MLCCCRGPVCSSYWGASELRILGRFFFFLPKRAKKQKPLGRRDRGAGRVASRWAVVARRAPLLGGSPAASPVAALISFFKQNTQRVVI